MRVCNKCQCTLHQGEDAKKDSKETVKHPPHYNKHPSGIECIEIVEHFNFNMGNAIKYIWRADFKKEAIQDLQKAEFYIKQEIAKRNKTQK